MDAKKNASQINMQKKWNNHNPEQEDISDLIRNRMKSLDLTLGDYCKFNVVTGHYLTLGWFAPFRQISLLKDLIV